MDRAPASPPRALQAEPVPQGMPAPTDDELAARRRRAVSGLLLERPPLLLPLADRFRDHPTVVESAIHGSSMAPTIRPRSRLRVQLAGQQPCATGDIVYYLADDGYMVHRVVYRPHAAAAAGYLLTQGDNCIAPDPPVPTDRVLGTVVAVHTARGWQPPGPPCAGRRLKRLLRGGMQAATIFAFERDVRAARGFAIAFREAERVARLTWLPLYRLWHRGRGR
jgi:hypothetical protein